MERSFTSKEAKQLIEEHSVIIRKLQSIPSQISSRENQIKREAKNLYETEIKETLNDIPIDEINREKRGIRVKLLKDNGYYTIADIASESVTKLASIYGVYVKVPCFANS